MNLQDMIVPNEDFQTSINIDFDFGAQSKIEALIPTDSVCRYLEMIVRDVIIASNQRAKLLVGAYGKGKSHVVLAALTAMWIKDASSFKRIIEAYRARGLGFGDTLEKFVTEGKRLLPVVISGSTSDLRHSLLHALRNALKLADLEFLMPQTNYDGAIGVLRRWAEEYPETLGRFEELTGNSAASVIMRLQNMDTAAYELFVEAYRSLTSGSSFDALDGAEVINVYEHVLNGLAEHGVSGIYVVYDEFSKYLETSIDRASFEDTKLLQDFAETCNRSGGERQLHLLLISHKSLSNYIDANLQKDKVDGWRGISGRFTEIEMVYDASQYYELLGNAITKNKSLWTDWLEKRGGENDLMLHKVGRRYAGTGLFEQSDMETITHGCYPLHPLTTYLLVRMSEKVAQNERTLFTFVCSHEEYSLSNALGQTELFVTPDCVYGYFEPLLRKEFYTSPLHRTYELARSSLRRVEEDSLEARIIKTIAAIDIVGQYDRIAPTRQNIVDIYTDCGYDVFDVDAALDRLVENDSVVYLRRSNAFLKLKETSGVRIDNEVSDRSEAIQSTYQPVQILNMEMSGRALYPSRYNEDKGMVRFFDCGFAGMQALQEWRPGRRMLEGEGDGEVVALYFESPDEHDKAKSFAKDALSENPMTVIVFPRKYIDISDALYKLEAAKQLKDEAAGDDVLVEEYEIVVEDYAAIVNEFIAGFFQPELGRSLYYAGGKRRNKITRKRKLSEELSELCYESYGITPRITSEALNKNRLTGTAFSSRTKIVKSLCARSLESNLGFIGSGQETSMARSAFKAFGGIEQLPEYPDLELSPKEKGLRKVLDEIQKYVEEAQETPFSKLYNSLTGKDLGIGLRKGPIPLYLAYVLRSYRDEIKIMHGHEERVLSETVLDDISKQPEAYTLTRLNWSPEMAEYVSSLAEIFGCDVPDANRNDVAEAIRLWYAELPQVTRNSKYDHTQPESRTATPKTRKAFFDAIRRIDTDSNVLLFEDLPRVFDAKIGTRELLESVSREKKACDDYVNNTVDRLAVDLTSMFDDAAHRDATLGSVLRDWLDAYPITETHVFSGASNLIISAAKAANGNDRVTVGRLAKAATSLRIEDWNDARFEDFFKIMLAMKVEIEDAEGKTPNGARGVRLGIMIIGDDGETKQKSFDKVECSGRSRLLKNNILACLNEMGGALQPEEKRQVVFEVLEELC